MHYTIHTTHRYYTHRRHTNNGHTIQTNTHTHTCRPRPTLEKQVL